MPRSSAERQFTTNLLTQAYRNLESLYPVTHEAQAHFTFSGNEEEDYQRFRFITHAAEKYVDEEEAEQTFAALSDIASVAIDDAQLLLADEWGVPDTDLILGDDPERTLTMYDAAIEGGQQVQLVDWDQPNPTTGKTARIVYAAFKPSDMMQPIQTVIYVDGCVLDARKRDQQTAAEEFDELCHRHLEPHLSEEAFEGLLDTIQHEIQIIVESDIQDGTLLATCVDMALMEVDSVHTDAQYALRSSIDAVIKEITTIQDDVASGRDLLTPDDAFLIERIIKNIPLRPLSA